MKQVNLSMLYAIMLCVLIGYFEPANAQTSLATLSSPTANVFLFSTIKNCHFWPNPVGQGATVNAYSDDVPTGGYLTSTLQGGQYAISVISAGQPLPTGEVENNYWFQPIVASPGSAISAADSAGSSDSSSLANNSVLTSGTAIDTTSSDSASAAAPSGSVSTLAATTPGGSTPPASETENNYYFQPIITVSTLSLPVVPDGTYILVITGQSGNVYTSQVNIASN